MPAPQGNEKGDGSCSKATRKERSSTRKEKEDAIKNTSMQKANDNLKQARRCEQISHRMTLRREADEAKRAEYEELNNRDVKGIRKHLVEENEKRERL